MRKLLCVVGLLLLAVPARAGVMDPLQTTGSWSQMPELGVLAGPQWFQNFSWDLGHPGLNLIADYRPGSAGWEYLHAAADENAPVAFAWNAPPVNMIWEIGDTAFVDGEGGWDSVTGAFTYNVPSYPGMHSTSLDRLQMVMLKLVTPTVTYVEIWVEDIIRKLYYDGECTLTLERCGDFTDNHVTFSLRALIPEQPPIPEPSTVALLTIGFLGIAYRISMGFAKRRYV